MRRNWGDQQLPVGNAGFPAIRVRTPLAQVGAAVRRSEAATLQVVSKKPPQAGEVSDGSTTPAAIFLFSGDDVAVEPSLEDATASVESVDVRNGVYDAVYDVDARRYEIAVVNGRPIITPTGDFDRPDLMARLHHFLVATGLSELLPADADAGDIATAVAQRQWDDTAPRRWIRRRKPDRE